MGNSLNHIKSIKVLTSLKEYSHCFIKANQKKTAVSMGNSANQEIQDSPPVLGDIWLQLFKNSTWFWLLSHKLKRPRMSFL